MTPYGEVKAPRRVAGEVREIDVWFTPKSPPNIGSEPSKLLEKLVATSCIIEPFRNHASSDEICDCLLKLLEIKGEVQREAHRNHSKISDSDLPKLWILTPTASATLLSGFGATLDPNWLPGIYFLPSSLRTAIIVIRPLAKLKQDCICV
jgi:hypothetical protein